MALTLHLTFFHPWRDSDILPNSYIKVSYKFTITAFIGEIALNFINDTRCKLFEKAIFEAINVW